MKSRTQNFLAFINLLFSFCAACIGFGLVGGSHLNFVVKAFFNFFFIMQVIAAVWLVLLAFKKEIQK